ncbi:MAG: FecR family protein [Burkholderiales bacterium]|nr:FecR family protein [Burkholderiales bacterium]
MRARLVAMAAWGALAGAAMAATTGPAAYVEAVQMPAWIERGASRAPLAPGMPLESTDRVRTGAGARLLVKTADGSAVRLGENATLAFDAIARPQARDGVFTAALQVVTGAFRFTTAALARGQKREVSVRFATVTAGIRGTDLWGKSAPDREIVCLIEGRIEVTRPGNPTVEMSEPRSFYIAPRDAPSLPVARVSDEQLAQWAAETEVEAGKGAARIGGRWKVVLASSASQEEALSVYGAARAAGYAVEIRPARSGGQRVYDAVIAQLPSQAEAEALAASLAGRFGAASPRVTR